MCWKRGSMGISEFVRASGWRSLSGCQPSLADSQRILDQLTILQEPSVERGPGNEWLAVHATEPRWHNVHFTAGRRLVRQRKTVPPGMNWRLDPATHG